jgi:hypothetical protein
VQMFGQPVGFHLWLEQGTWRWGVCSVTPGPDGDAALMFASQPKVMPALGLGEEPIPLWWTSGFVLASPVGTAALTRCTRCRH